MKNPTHHSLNSNYLKLSKSIPPALGLKQREIRQLDWSCTQVGAHVNATAAVQYQAREENSKWKY